jgi:hypothetical protein
MRGLSNWLHEPVRATFGNERKADIKADPAGQVM